MIFTSKMEKSCNQLHYQKHFELKAFLYKIPYRTLQGQHNGAGTAGAWEAAAELASSGATGAQVPTLLTSRLPMKDSL